jgi:hypothetical protein
MFTRKALPSLSHLRNASIYDFLATRSPLRTYQRSLTSMAAMESKNDTYLVVGAGCCGASSAYHMKKAQSFSSQTLPKQNHSRWLSRQLLHEIDARSSKVLARRLNL